MHKNSKCGIVGFLFFSFSSIFLMLLTVVSCWADGTRKITLTIIYSRLYADITCDDYSADYPDTAFDKQPTIAVIPETPQIIKKAEGLVRNWQPGTTLSVGEFEDKLLPEVDARCEDSNCGNLRCIKVTYELVIECVPATTIVIRPHNPKKLPEYATHLALDHSTSTLYHAEAYAPVLTEHQRRKLECIVREIAEAADAAGIKPCQLRDNDAVESFEDNIVSDFGLELYDRLRVTVDEDYKFIYLDNFPLVDDNIDVHLTNWRDRVSELSAQGKVEVAEKYNEKVAEREAKIMAGIKHFLPDSLIFSTAQIAGAKKAWENSAPTRFTENKIVAKDDNGTNNKLVLEANEPARIFTVDLSVGVRYSTETNVQGTAKMETENLLNRGDTLSVNASWGGQAGEATAAWKGTLINFKDDHYASTYSVTGSYGKNDRVPFGQLTTTNIQAETWDAQITTSINFDSLLSADHAAFEGQADKRKMSRYWVGYTLGATVSKYHGSQNGALATPINNRSMSINNGLGIGFTLDLHENNAAYFSHVTGRLRLNIENAWGDDSYAKASVQPEVDVFFGNSKDSRDFFLRVVGRGGTSSGNPPYPALFRLGGSDGVRGLETTELTGASYIGTSEEFGIRLSRFFPKQKKADNSEKKGSSFDPSNFYLKIFYDWIQSGGSNATQGSTVNAKASAHGYGIALEIEKVAITEKQFARFAFGYAFSPESNMNRGGTVNVEFSTEF